jgi:biopolymer transport protein ExbB
MGEEWSYFQILVWPGGGVIGIVLWCLSIVTIAIIVEHFIAIRRVNILPPLAHEQIRTMFDNKEYREVIDYTAAEPSYLSYVTHAALTEAAHGYPAMERAMEEAGEERTTKLLRHIEWLNLIGNISPMMGLLGTVWGMIQVFFKIVEAGTMPDPGQLAEGIGIALVTTLLGLAIAIPSLAIYSVMRNKIDALSSEAMVVCQDLISNFRPGAKST